MTSDLIALVVAITLGIAVVGLGLRRNLADVTQSWLPRFGEAPEPATAPPGSLFDSGQRRRQLSPRQRRFYIWGYLLLSACNAALAVLWVDNRLMHVLIAAGFATCAVVVMLRGRHLP